MKKGPQTNKCRGLSKLEKAGKWTVPCSFQVARGLGHLILAWKPMLGL